KQGHLTQAEQLFQQVADEQVEQIKHGRLRAAAAFRNLGAIAGLSDPRRALQAYGRALELDQEDRESLYWYGWLNQLAGNLPVAAEALNKLLRISDTKGDDRGIFLANLRLGESDLTRGNRTAALEHENVAIAIAKKESVAAPQNVEWS